MIHLAIVDFRMHLMLQLLYIMHKDPTLALTCKLLWHQLMMVGVLICAHPSASAHYYILVSGRPQSPLAGIFNGVIDLCQRGLNETANMEAERSVLKTDAIHNDATIQTLQDQASQRQDDVRRLRDQLEQKEAELDYTRGLLMAKWASNKRVREE